VRESAGGDGRALLKAIAQAKRQFTLPAATPGRSCYEAGREGFWRPRKIGIGALARPLRVARWRYLAQGGVPAGALRKG